MDRIKALHQTAIGDRFIPCWCNTDYSRQFPATAVVLALREQMQKHDLELLAVNEDFWFRMEWQGGRFAGHLFLTCDDRLVLDIHILLGDIAQADLPLASGIDVQDALVGFFKNSEKKCAM